LERLSATVWTPAQEAHEARVDAATAAHLRRREDGRGHPVEDFLFTYYRHRPAQLRRWHPGPGVALDQAAHLERADWRFYRTVGDAVVLDVEAFMTARGEAVGFVAGLVGATRSRPAQLGCFGLHEWAMVYRLGPEELRHAAWPLRLGTAGTDAVVEEQQIRCTHYDAFRFYTPPARSLNLLQPTRETQPELEQPGCLHAGMDLYKWAYKLSPAIPSDLVMDCFDLAREIRQLDMRASPYDLAELGYEPVRIETAAGRAEYAAAQRGFAARGQELRGRLLAVCAALGASPEASTAADSASDSAPVRRPAAARALPAYRAAPGVAQRTGTPARTRP
jgi:hypothetical protein